jgi:hypothetical protein
VILLNGALTVPFRYREEFASLVHDADGLIHRDLIGGIIYVAMFFSEVDFIYPTVLQF